MTPQQEHDLVKRICNGNTEAEQWIQLMRLYVHLIDDIIDEDLVKLDRARGAKRICQMGVMALSLFTAPFFLKNSAALSTIITSMTVAYWDSVGWEAETGWKRDCSNWIRHGHIEVCIIIACICGGYEHATSVSKELRQLAHELHQGDREAAT